MFDAPNFVLANNYKMFPKCLLLWIVSLWMNNKQKNLLLYLLVDKMWFLYYLCSSQIVKLDSGQTRVEIYSGRGTHVGLVMDPHTK